MLLHEMALSGSAQSKPLFLMNNGGRLQQKSLKWLRNPECEAGPFFLSRSCNERISLPKSTLRLLRLKRLATHIPADGLIKDAARTSRAIHMTRYGMKIIIAINVLAGLTYFIRQ